MEWEYFSWLSFLKKERLKFILSIKDVSPYRREYFLESQYKTVARTRGEDHCKTHKRKYRPTQTCLWRREEDDEPVVYTSNEGNQLRG